MIRMSVKLIRVWFESSITNFVSSQHDCQEEASNSNY